MQLYKGNSRWQVIGEVVVLLRKLPVTIYVMPLVAALTLYVILGSTAWLTLTPLWKELAGEWDIVGRFVAVIAWILLFPIIFNLLLSLVVGFAFDPLASAVDNYLHLSERRDVPGNHQLVDGVARFASLCFLQLIATFIGSFVPFLGLIVSGASSIIGALVITTTPAAVHRGLRFPTHIRLIAHNLNVPEIAFGFVAAIMLNNPVLQVISLVPLIVTGQLITRGWIKNSA